MTEGTARIPLLAIELFALTHLVRVATGFEHFACAHRIQASLRGDIDQHFAIARIATFGEVRGEQRALQFALPTFELCPVQQSMCVERVVDAGALAHFERETQIRAARAKGFPITLQLFRRRAVLLHEVFGDVLAARRQLRIELERLEMNLGSHGIADALQRLFERAQPDHAPGTGDIRHEVDLELGSHERRMRA